MKLRPEESIFFFENREDTKSHTLQQLESFGQTHIRFFRTYAIDGHAPPLSAKSVRFQDHHCASPHWVVGDFLNGSAQKSQNPMLKNTVYGGGSGETSSHPPHASRPNIRPGRLRMSEAALGLTPGKWQRISSAWAVECYTELCGHAHFAAKCVSSSMDFSQKRVWDMRGFPDKAGDILLLNQKRQNWLSKE